MTCRIPLALRSGLAWTCGPARQQGLPTRLVPVACRDQPRIVPAVAVPSTRSTCSGEALVVKSNRIRSSEHATWHLSKSEMLGGDWTSIFGSLQQLGAKVDGTVGDANPLDAIEDALSRRSRCPSATRWPSSRFPSQYIHQLWICAARTASESPGRSHEGRGSPRPHTPDLGLRPASGPAA